MASRQSIAVPGHIDMETMDMAKKRNDWKISFKYYSDAVELTKENE